MSTVIIQNPVINSAFREPDRHFRFDDEGITSDVVDGRRTSSYFVPIPASKKKGASSQLALETEWTQDRIEENVLVNQIRGRVNLWRQGGYLGVTATTRRLLDYWTNPDRERKLFFCQIEALETAIYITECASRFGDQWIANQLKEANDSSNPGLPRAALKMATGAGKTVVMGMLIAWQALNKLEHRQDARFSDSFLIVAPGITIRDRLRVLLPNDPQNYYAQRDLIPPWDIERLGQARIVITNYHAFQPREKVKAAKITKQVLGAGDSGIFTESPDEVVRRVCRDLGTSKQIVVLNDEAHHCYRRRPDTEIERLAKAEQDLVAPKLTGDDLQESKQREEEARVWIRGIEWIQQKIGIKTVFDLSATPFFLRGSGYAEGTLFPWVVSDFSLIDAIESGIVKVPRVPVADDSMVGELPTYRDLWARIRDELPKKGRKTDSVAGTEPRLPKVLEGSLHSLYNDYRKSFERWQEHEADRPGGSTPPVFIVVCNNTNVSKLVYDYIGGWEKTVTDDHGVEHKVVVPGALDLFRNDDDHQGWLPSPYTILVDSQQLESGEAMSDDFKRAAAREIEEFKAEYRLRFPGRDTDDLKDEDLLREVMNTVGKPGRLGEQIRCVVSVSMLTEGWDANTVTHILGVRAFGTQLLCEQVVGRALRRMSYAADENGMFPPEYAEVYGIPFSFIPSNGAAPDPVNRKIPTRVKALKERAACEITFPRLVGYRYEIPDGRLTANFGPDAVMELSTLDMPSLTETKGSVGETSMHETWDRTERRFNRVAFEIASEVMKALQDPEGNPRPWLFPQVLEITRSWLTECVVYGDGTHVGWLVAGEYRHEAAEKIYRAIVQGEKGEPRVLPILRAYDAVGSTTFVDFDTTKPVYVTDPAKCHVSHAVLDTNDWEQKMTEVLEGMPEVVRYVKNEHLGFSIPYSLEGRERTYIPDFIACIDDGHGSDDLLNLIVEVSGEAKKEKATKAATARTFWIPAVNNHGGFGRWAYVEITDPWNSQSDIRGHVYALNGGVVG
jgi:type III restriction enzyme